MLGLSSCYHTIIFEKDGVSYLMRFDSYDPVSSYLMSVYSCPSAKQMMYYYVEPNGTLTTDYHDDWQEILDDMGFPRGDYGHSIENLSIVNGGSLGSPNSCLFDLSLSIGNNSLCQSGWMELLLRLFTHASNLSLSLEAYRNNGNGGLLELAQCIYKKKFAWLSVNKLISVFGSSPQIRISPNGTVPLDYVNSSYVSIKDDIGITSGSDYLSVSFPDKRVPFVPAASALAISDYTFQTPPDPHEETPFDTYYLNESAKSHSATKPSSSSLSYFDWLYNQVNCSLSGPKGVAMSGDVFSVNAPSGCSSPTWSVSDNSSFSISNGILSFGNSAPVKAITISYNNTDGANTYMSKRRTLLTGFPEMIANFQHISSNSYRVTASCTSAHAHLQPILDSLAADGSIRFVWGVKTNGGSISWADTTNTRSFVCTALLGDLTHVYMKMHCEPNRESVDPIMAEIDRRTNIQFFFDPKETIVRGLFGIPHYVYTSIPIMYDCLVVWHNSDYNGTPVAPDNIKIGNQTIPLADTCSLSINGETKTAYCFDFMSSTGAQNALAAARADYLAGDPYVSFLTINIRNGTTTLQAIDYPFIPDDH